MAVSGDLRPRPIQAGEQRIEFNENRRARHFEPSCGLPVIADAHPAATRLGIDRRDRLYAHSAIVGDTLFQIGVRIVGREDLDDQDGSRVDYRGLGSRFTITRSGTRTREVATRVRCSVDVITCHRWLDSTRTSRPEVLAIAHAPICPRCAPAPRRLCTLGQAGTAYRDIPEGKCEPVSPSIWAPFVEKCSTVKSAIPGGSEPETKRPDSQA